MAEGILEGIRILDMAEGLAGSVAAMLLAESGADVVKVESPNGRDRPNRHGIRTWDRSKRSVVVDIETSEGRGQLESLLAAADVLIHEVGPGRASILGLDHTSLAQ